MDGYAIKPLTPETWDAWATLVEKHNGTRHLFEQAGFAYVRPKGKNHCVMRAVEPGQPLQCQLPRRQDVRMNEKAQSTRSTDGFSDEERAAMKERAQELKSAKKRRSAADRAKADEQDVLTRIAELPEADRALAERIHAIITDAAPDLIPRTWYGMPAYAKDGKVLCFFQGAEKFKSRYATLGFNDPANLDDGTMWPTAFAVTEVTDDVEKRIRQLVTSATA